MEYSALQKARYEYQPKLPSILRNPIHSLVAVTGEATSPAQDAKQIKDLFPSTFGLPKVDFEVTGDTVRHEAINMGVILSGGQAPGGHNVISGLYDALKNANPESSLYGFLGGPSGLLEDRKVLFDDAFIDEYRNTGGFDIIGSGRTKTRDHRAV